MAVSKRLRYEILRRDNHTCRYCGASAPDVPLRVDHVTAVALGGTDSPDNLVTSCEPCNSGKSSMPADAALVSGVADSALHWAAAIKQAAEELRAQAEPKQAYRDTFQQAWNEWTWERNGKREPHELEDGWKSSIDNFREAGLPVEVWPDIIEKAMTNKTVKAENLFRYTCGIAWRMVRELQEAARAIVGAKRPNADVEVRTVVREAAFAVWYSGLSNDEDEAPSAQQAEEFRRSLNELTDWDLTGEPGRVIEAAQHAAYFDISDVAEALKDLDRSRIWSAWISAWPRTYVPGETDDPWGGRYVGGPGDKEMDRVREKIKKLLDADVPAFRIAQAATYAGFHKSARFYRGLTDAELAASGESPLVARLLELWRTAFVTSGKREPSAEEIAQFFASLTRITGDGDFVKGDVWAAASAAGAYQDPDLSTCLPRRRSVFEAAARPLAQSA